VKRFLPAVALLLAILATAPAIRPLQRFVFEHLGGADLLKAAFGAIALGLLVFSIWRIRERRLLRYSGLVLSGIGVLAMAAGFRQGQLEVDLVERIHIVEYGLMAFLLYWALRPRGGVELLLLPLLGATIAGTIDEWWQWYVPQRTGEIRDVAMNAAAGLCGLVFCLSVWPPESSVWKLSPGAGRRLLRTTAVGVLVLGLFAYCAHLGHWVENPEIGRFRSWFTEDELREIAQRRAEEWPGNPPVELEVYAHEDYYLTEAGWHFHHRNASLKYETNYLAWQANRILEEYYAPFLDTLGHRWPEELRREVEKKVPPFDPAGYVSPVLEHRIVTSVSQPVFLTVLAAVFLALWFAPALLPGTDSRAGVEN